MERRLACLTVRRITPVIKKAVQGFISQLRKDETALEDREGDPDWKMVIKLNFQSADSMGNLGEFDQVLLLLYLI